MIFAVSFLGALFAILAALAIVYTYVMLFLIPRLKRGIHEWIAEMGPKAIFEQAKVDPAEAMRELGIDVVHPSRRPGGEADRPWVKDVCEVVYTCEDHGRCPGCPKVIAQFEAILRHQGALDEIERRCYDALRAQLAGDGRESMVITDEEDVA
jgi:hypothetical protein